jgi:hypothetical protein
MAPFAAGASPLGGGPIALGTGAGADFGAVLGTVTPLTSDLTVTESLAGLAYAATSDTTLHASCTGGCGSSRIYVRVLATSSTDTLTSWPYSRAGLLECELAASTSPVVVPKGAIAAKLASDTALDTAITSIVLLAASPFTGRDSAGDVLTADAGHGVYGVSHLP